MNIIIGDYNIYKEDFPAETSTVSNPVLSYYSQRVDGLHSSPAQKVA